jgi:hypothetical protein
VYTHCCFWFIALPIGQDSGPANADCLKKVKRYPQLAEFFTMTLQLRQILALLTGTGFIFKARWLIYRAITATLNRLAVFKYNM